MSVRTKTNGNEHFTEQETKLTRIYFSLAIFSHQTDNRKSVLYFIQLLHSSQYYTRLQPLTLTYIPGVLVTKKKVLLHWFLKDFWSHLKLIEFWVQFWIIKLDKFSKTCFFVYILQDLLVNNIALRTRA